MSKQTMSPKKIREEIDSVDRRMAELEVWATRLSITRDRYLLAGKHDVVNSIDEGFAPFAGRPDDDTLQLIGTKLPALRETERTVHELRERRALLTADGPSASEVSQ